MTKILLLIHILKHSKHERVLQYLDNRIPTDKDAFNITDRGLLNILRRHDNKES